MASTYLQITNELLREINEVALTSANFTDARGIQQHVKDCINRAYLDIVNEEAQWPFLNSDLSGSTIPLYGNSSVETVAGQRFYILKDGSTGVHTDFGYVDWDNFYITTDGVAGETAPYMGRNLKFITIEEWKDFQRVRENLDAADTQNYGEPRYVIRSPDNRKFGLSPIPDKAYKVWFYAFEQPTQLSAYSDEIAFQDMYKPVLLARARYYLHQFKEELQAASFADQEYRRGLKMMKHNLMGPTPSYMKDDRMRVV